MPEELKYWIALKWVEGVGNRGFRNLLQAFGDPRAVFGLPVKTLRSVPEVGEKTARRIQDFKDWEKVEAELAKAAALEVRIVTCKDPDYPQHLLNIHDYPPFLYVRGALLPRDIRLAVVGSRAASPYGRYTTERLCRELAQWGITVVSGLARGIDAAAHRGALAGRGRTIAVLGCGLDVAYPPENKRLSEEIACQGGIVTEYALGTPPNGPHFPARNRIISGMSLGVVVVEAGEKSGSLITARLALEQGREVFAIPGSIDTAGARGANRLIKEGAKLVDCVEDILEEIAPQIERKREAPAVSPAGETAPGLTEGERRLLDLVSEGAFTPDELIARMGLSPGETLSTLMTLEIKGLIRQLPGKQFIKKE